MVQLILPKAVTADQFLDMLAKD